MREAELNRYSGYTHSPIMPHDVLSQLITEYLQSAPHMRVSKSKAAPQRAASRIEMKRHRKHSQMTQSRLRLSNGSIISNCNVMGKRGNDSRISHILSISLEIQRTTIKRKQTRAKGTVICKYAMLTVNVRKIRKREKIGNTRFSWCMQR